MMNEKVKQKMRGGYYTPKEISDFLSDWAIGSNKDLEILEPSMGDGNFILSVAEKLLSNGASKKSIGKNVWGIEFIKEEKDKVTKRLKASGFSAENFNIFNDDYFSVFDKMLYDKKYDIIVGNPPFIRYQNFPEKQRDLALKILKQKGFKLNKLTNAWLFFLLLSATCLKEKGKIAMVIPAELLQVKYAEQARVFLSNHFQSVSIVTFKKLVFEGIQQEVVLVLAEKNEGEKNKGIDVIEIESAKDLKELNKILGKPTHFKPVNPYTDKWTQYFLNKNEINLIKKVLSNEKIKPLGDILEIDVGIVTGRNNFFVINQEAINKHQLHNYVIPLVGRTAHINGSIVFDENNWKDLSKKGEKVFLLSINGAKYEDLGKGVLKYIKQGEQNDIDKGYKCRIRKRWYSVPSVWTPDAFLFRQIYKFPKIVLNKANVVTTDTIHRVRIKKGVNKEQAVASFMNSLTLAFSEIFGRSYGGGVLELEPSEAENIPLPYFAETRLNFDKTKKMIENSDINNVLDYTDAILLKKHLKFSESDIKMFRNIWKKLSERRLARK
jgi:adenine-specific DNA-methyltransferase